MAGLALASYKLRIHEGHIRAVPANGPDGAAFDGPGVDLRADDAAAALAAAQPMLAWLAARQPGAVVRSISVRIAPNTRVLVSIEPRADDPRPHALRFDPPDADALREAGGEAERLIGEACRRILAAHPRRAS